MTTVRTICVSYLKSEKNMSLFFALSENVCAIRPFQKDFYCHIKLVIHNLDKVDFFQIIFCLILVMAYCHDQILELLESKALLDKFNKL